MKRYNKNLGDFGEAAAADFLTDKGYIILERNYRTRSGEIDIIALDENELVFAEVKTRSSLKFGFPSEAVGKEKIKHIVAAAGEYYRNNPTEKDIRYDVIEVIAHLSDESFEVSSIEHMKDVIFD